MNKLIFSCRFYFSPRLFANALSLPLLLCGGTSIPPEDRVLSNTAPLKRKTETMPQE
ncbi:MAG: hypothetical protein LBK00_05445 [Treponema sp.]|nr:hypothetical protein [Treponema sp.]